MILTRPERYEVDRVEHVAEDAGDVDADIVEDCKEQYETDGDAGKNRLQECRPGHIGSFQK